MSEHETIAALTEQVNVLRQQADTARATVTRWDARLEREGIGATIVVRTELRRLREQVDELSAAAGSHRKQRTDPPAPCWEGLSPDEFAAQLTALANWVDGFLRVHYPGYALASCWRNHPEALWELGTLHAEWQRVYADPDNRDLAGALWWHERWLPGTLGRLARATAACDEGGWRLLASWSRARQEETP